MTTSKPRPFSRAPGDRRWYSVRAAERSDPAEIFIYDEIGVGWFGGGVSAEQFVSDVKALKLSAGDPLRVRINSPGGDLFDGNTIYNYLRSTNLDIEVRIDGVAASAASIVAMAGNTVSMPENSFLMIHNPWMVGIGDARTFRKVADDLDTLRDGAVSTYMTRVRDKLREEELIAMLDEETWLPAADAVEYGFADVVDEPVRAAALAKFDFSAFGLHPPERLARIESLSERRAERRKQLEARRSA